MNSSKLFNPTTKWFLISFIIWILVFLPFVYPFPLFVEDATSYYDHTKFLLENLIKGVFPLWDPYWFNGASNDFFLRRIGAYNPFYSIIIILEFIGFSFHQGYISFLVVYYFSSAIAFYLLLRRFKIEKWICFCGFLIFLFSSLGTRIFDSYMMLVTVPIVWFFYFAVSFFQTFKVVYFYGLIIFIGILISTYIPLYFLSFIALFILIYSLFYFGNLFFVIKKTIQFFKSNKFTCIFSVLFVLLMLLPALSFYKSSKESSFSMPARSYATTSSNPLEVSKETLNWGAVEDIVFSSYFTHLNSYKFATVYIPFIVLIFFFLGVVSTIKIRSFFIYVVFLTLTCLIIPNGLPFYNFLYEHLHFLKYFRNLHFFIWFMLIPLIIFLSIDHLNTFICENSMSIRMKKIWIILLHLILTVFVAFYLKGQVIIYLVIGLSFTFLWILLTNKIAFRSKFLYFFLSILVLIEPIYLYINFVRMTPKPSVAPSTYYFDSNVFKFTNSLQLPKDTKEISPMNFYFVKTDLSALYNNLSTYAILKYTQNKLMLFDDYKPYSQAIDYPLLENIFRSKSNLALIKEDKLDKDLHLFPNLNSKATLINPESKEIRLVNYNVNQLTLMSVLDHQQLLVYNDNYDPKWHVYIDGKEEKLYKANGSFKGVILREGKHRVDFKYGTLFDYFFNWSLLFLNFLLLFLLIRTSIQMKLIK